MLLFIILYYITFILYTKDIAYANTDHNFITMPSSKYLINKTKSNEKLKARLRFLIIGNCK